MIGAGAIFHSFLHTNAYYDFVNEMIGMCTTKQEVIETLSRIKDMLLSEEL